MHSYCKLQVTVPAVRYGAAMVNVGVVDLFDYRLDFCEGSVNVKTGDVVLLKTGALVSVRCVLPHTHTHTHTHTHRRSCARARA
jgi:hypothetical protein